MRTRLQIVLVLFAIGASVYLMWPGFIGNFGETYPYPVPVASPSEYTNIDCNTLPATETERNMWSSDYDRPVKEACTDDHDATEAERQKAIKTNITVNKEIADDIRQDWSGVFRKELWIIVFLVSGLVLVGGVKTARDQKV